MTAQNEANPIRRRVKMALNEDEREVPAQGQEDRELVHAGCKSYKIHTSDSIEERANMTKQGWWDCF